jgi:hypothetical protein
MKILISREQLELLLEKKRDFIGKKITIDTIIAGISFLISVWTANYETIWSIPGIVFKTIFCVIGIVYMIKIIYDIIDFKNNNYTHTDLLRDIEGLDMIQHNHSLIIIKNNAPGIKTKYLTYYDERWDCKLFPNLKTADKDNEAFIISNLSNDLGIPKKEIKCKYISSRVQEKYSVSHNENRVYNHRLYEVEFKNIPKIMNKNDFSINSRHYYWMTISEMEKDDNIMKKNMEVVDFVKECEK